MGVIKIKNSLLGDSAFSEWIASVADEENKNQIMLGYLKASIDMIDNMLENKEDDPGFDILHKAMESSDPKYNDVSIAIDYSPPNREGPVFKVYSLRPIEDFTLDSEGKTATITELGESHIYEQFYGEKQSRDILKNAANAESFLENIKVLQTL